MKKKRWYVALLALAAAATLSLSGCGKNSSSKSDKTTISVAIAGSNDEMAIRKKLGQQYMKSHPKVKIQWVNLGTDRFEKTMTLISGGESPDILYLNEWTTALAQKGALEPLNGMIKKDKSFKLSEYYPDYIKANTYEGKIYALPSDITPFAIYYNKDMFKEAGLKQPTNNWTQAEFYHDAKVLTSKSDKRYGYIVDNLMAPTIGYLARNDASLSVDEKMHKSALGSANALKTLKFLNRFTKEGISPNPAQTTASGQGSDAMFRNRQVAMFAAGMWFVPSFTEDPLPFQWDCVRMPKGDNQRGNAGQLAWGISKASKHKKAAWSFLKYLVGKQGETSVAKAGMAIPSMKTAAMRDKVRELPQPANKDAFLAGMGSNNIELYTPKSAELNVAFNDEFERMLLGKDSPKVTQKKLVKSFNTILE